MYKQKMRETLCIICYSQLLSFQLGLAVHWQPHHHLSPIVTSIPPWMAGVTWLLLPMGQATTDRHGAVLQWRRRTNQQMALFLVSSCSMMVSSITIAQSSLGDIMNSIVFQIRWYADTRLRERDCSNSSDVQNASQSRVIYVQLLPELDVGGSVQVEATGLCSCWTSQCTFATGEKYLRHKVKREVRWPPQNASVGDYMVVSVVYGWVYVGHWEIGRASCRERV